MSHGYDANTEQRWLQWTEQRRLQWTLECFQHLVLGCHAISTYRVPGCSDSNAKHAVPLCMAESRRSSSCVCVQAGDSRIRVLRSWDMQCSLLQCAHSRTCSLHSSDLQHNSRCRSVYVSIHKRVHLLNLGCALLCQD